MHDGYNIRPGCVLVGRVASIIITAADAERVHGSLPRVMLADMERGKKRKTRRIQGLTEKTYWTVSFRENLRLAGDECKSKPLERVHTAGSGFRVHFVEN